MCGFVGYVGTPAPLPLLEFSRDLLSHRGPDASGTWEGRGSWGRVGLGFRRLKILDVSPAADQPMERRSLRIVYNGEIYNFRQLRSELEGRGHRFLSTGDTEVLLAAYQEWGLNAIPRLEGMFSLAIWDGDRDRLVLARDRLGIKPLYYARYNDRLVFGSEPKALLSLGEIPARVDERSLSKFLTFLWVPDPDTLFSGVKKLPPAHLAVFDGTGERTAEYWDLKFEDDRTDAETHVERLRNALRQAVRRQLVSDVPLGVFLSGGVDSTLIAALAAEASSHPVLAIATGFERSAQRYEVGEDDLPYARLAARSISNLDYREIVLSDLSADVAADIAPHFDDPVADPAAISTYLICRAAKPEATVMLSGVGSEEQFAGYPRHRAVKSATVLSSLPQPLRRTLSRASSLVPGARPGTGMGRLRHARKFLEGVGEPDPYIGFCAHHTKHSLSRLLGQEVDWDTVTEAHQRHLHRAADLPALSRALYLDVKSFLTALNLAYTDRSSMACSVEVRVPVLDEMVVTTATSIPEEMKMRNGVGKWILKRAATGLVPEPILRRPKTGFGAPVRTWMRSLKGDVARDCLSEEALKGRGLLSAEAVQRMRQDLLEGKADQSLQLWAVVILELWARNFLDQPLALSTASAP